MVSDIHHKDKLVQRIIDDYMYTVLNCNTGTLSPCMYAYTHLFCLRHSMLSGTCTLLTQQWFTSSVPNKLIAISTSI